tara:strand:- start:16361 stop:16732 length:372 start_codon:yes stop_codon:yes gene_type:complete
MLILPILQKLLIDKMQKTRFKKFLESFILIVNPLVSDSWTKRSILLISVLSGFYFTNSLISFLLDKSINTVFLALIILITMEISIRALLFSKFSKLSLTLFSINNFRIGSTYALILEAFKLGS